MSRYPVLLEQWVTNCSELSGNHQKKGIKKIMFMNYSDHILGKGKKDKLLAQDENSYSFKY